MAVFNFEGKVLLGCLQQQSLLWEVMTMVPPPSPSTSGAHVPEHRDIPLAAVEECRFQGATPSDLNAAQLEGRARH